MYTNLNIKIDLVKAFLLLKNTYYMQTEIFSFCVQKIFEEKSISREAGIWRYR